MEIEAFIKTTLRQVISGVNVVDQEQISQYDVTLDRAKGIEFDLAVTAESSGEKSASAGVRIHILQGGVDGKSSTKESSVSRIKFKVYP